MQRLYGKGEEAVFLRKFCPILAQINTFAINQTNQINALENRPTFTSRLLLFGL